LPDVPVADTAGVEPQVAEALETAREHVLTNLQDGEAWGTYGMTLDIHTFETEATLAYEAAAALDADDFRWTYFAAVMHDRLRRPDAEEWLRRAVHLRRDYPPLLRRFADLMLEEGALDSAEAYYRQTTLFAPSFPHPYVGLARVAMLQGDVERAQEQALRGLDLNVMHAELHLVLAEIHRQLGNDSAAEASRTIGEQLQLRQPLPDPVAGELVAKGVSSYVAMTRGNVYMSNNQLPRALTEFQRAAEIRPDADALAALATVERRMGLFPSAETHFKEALELAPDDKQALLGLITVLIQSGDTAEANTYLRRARAAHPDAPEVEMTLATIALEGGQWQTGLRHLRAAQAKAPDDYRVLQQLATLYFRAPDPRVRSLDDAQRTAERVNHLLAERDIPTLTTLAEMRLEREDRDGAINLLLRARRLALIRDDQQMARRIEQVLNRVGPP
jgi:tetratricopeptide (TPR) repeat protein